MSNYQRYLSSLPLGLDSYPECQVKAAFLGDTFANAPVAFDIKELPAVLRTLIENPPPASVFIPTVHFLALGQKLNDAFGSEQDFIKYTVARNREKLSSPLYRALFLFLAPRSLVQRAAGRWLKIHKGITLEANLVGPRSCDGVFRYPAHIAPPTSIKIWTQIVCVGLEFAGAKNLEVFSRHWSPTEGTFSVRWE